MGKMQMNMPMDQTASQLPSPHEGSGTAWQPASVRGYEWMWVRGGWELMAHGVIFADYNQQGGPRGEGKAESVNWGMTMEQHKLGKGTILLRQMFSAESLTSPHPGFPELFQTGETYHGEPLVDHQHPHNVFAELAGFYTLPLTKKVSWELYGGPSAEPALGPVTYLHRASASELPLAPLAHHLHGFNPYELRRGDNRIRDRPAEAGSLGVQWARAERETLEHPVGSTRFLVGAGQHCALGELDSAIQHWAAGAS